MRTSTTAALALVALVLAAGSTACADESPSLALPLTATLAIVDAPESPNIVAPPVRARFSAPAGSIPPPPDFIPPRIHIPDLYNVDFDRDAPRFATPVDGDRYFAFEFVKPTLWRPRVALTYDKESLPIGDGSNRVSLELKLRF